VIEFALTEEQQSLRELAHHFATKEIRRGRTRRPGARIVALPSDGKASRHRLAFSACNDLLQRSSRRHGSALNSCELKALDLKPLLPETKRR
jgi:hypothetical protein